MTRKELGEEGAIQAAVAATADTQVLVGLLVVLIPAADSEDLAEEVSEAEARPEAGRVFFSKGSQSESLFSFFPTSCKNPVFGVGLMENIIDLAEAE